MHGRALKARFNALLCSDKKTSRGNGSTRQRRKSIAASALDFSVSRILGRCPRLEHETAPLAL